MRSSESPKSPEKEIYS